MKITKNIFSAYNISIMLCVATLIAIIFIISSIRREVARARKLDNEQFQLIHDNWVNYKNTHPKRMLTHCVASENPCSCNHYRDSEMRQIDAQTIECWGWME